MSCYLDLADEVVVIDGSNSPRATKIAATRILDDNVELPQVKGGADYQTMLAASGQRNRAMLALRNGKHGEAKTLQTIGDRFDLTRERVRQVTDKQAERVLNQPPYKNKLKFVSSLWPQEFEWAQISRSFQKGYDACTGDWVVKCDLDTIFSEGSLLAIRDRLESNPDEAGAHFYKMQFLLVDRFNVKTRQVLAVNKGKYGDRIKFNGGGDGCQPTLDGQLLDEDNTLKMQLPCYNYDFSWKSKYTIKRDFGRFARAWAKQRGEYEWGGPDDDSAFEHFLAMQVGRYYGRSHEVLKLTQHPKYVQAKIEAMTPEQFGYSLWNATSPATYFTT